MLVFCESDAVYPPEYVAAIVRPVLECPDGSIVAVSNVGRGVLEETAGWGHRYARLLYAAVDDAIRRGVRRTGAWAFESSWFRAHGGYRESLWVGEDVDLVERVVASGHKVAYGGDVPFFHREPRSLLQLFRRARRSGAGSPRRAIIALVAAAGASAVCGMVLQMGWAGLVAGSLFLVLAALILDPTWRVVVGFSVRKEPWLLLIVTSVARLAWIAGYVVGALGGSSHPGRARSG